MLILSSVTDCQKFWNSHDRTNIIIQTKKQSSPNSRQDRRKLRQNLADLFEPWQSGWKILSVRNRSTCFKLDSKMKPLLHRYRIVRENRFSVLPSHLFLLWSIAASSCLSYNCILDHYRYTTGTVTIWHYLDPSLLKHSILEGFSQKIFSVNFS